MTYQVFARKYRPQVFEDVVAQQHVTKTLQNAVANDRVASGYLFCGPRGTGKTTTARILAKALNCVKGPTPTPCGECDPCKEIAAGASLDVLEIDAASNTGVDDVRTLRENVRYLPTGGKKRIYIIDEVHRLSGAAFDALLKTLEEPPAHVIFVFATTEPLKVPETILSRTQRFDFKRVSVADLVEHLRKIAQAENLAVEETALQLLARKADGSVRDALSLLDQVAAFADDRITEQEVVKALGLIDRQMLFDFTTAVAARDGKQVLELCNRVLDAGVDVSDFVDDLLEHLRILLVLSVDTDAASVLKLTDEELATYRDLARNFSVGDLVRMMKTVGDTRQDLRFGLDERLVLELTGIRLVEMEATVKFEEILERMNVNPDDAISAGNDLFGQRKKKGDAVTLKRSAEGAESTLPPPGRSVTIAQVRAEWETFLGFLRQKNQMLASQLAMAEIGSLTDNRLRLVFGAANNVSRQVVDRPANVKIIEEALREHFQSAVRVTFEVDRNRPESPASPDNRFNNRVDVTQLLKNSPRLRTLMEKIDGEIVGVRKLK